MNRILLLLSGGDVVPAVKSVLEAAQLRPETEIVLLYIVDEQVPASVSSWLIYVGFMGDKPSDDYRHTILKEYRRRAQEDLSDVQSQISAAGLPCRTRLEEGELLRTLRRVAAEEDARQILMALPGKSDVGAALYQDAAKSLQKEAAFEIKIV